MTKEQVMEQTFEGKVAKARSLDEISLAWVLSQLPDLNVDHDHILIVEGSVAELYALLRQLSSLIDKGYIFRISFKGMDHFPEVLNYCVLYRARTGEYLVQSARGIIFDTDYDLFAPDHEKIEAILATGVKPYTPWEADGIFLKFLAGTSSEIPDGRPLGSCPLADRMSLIDDLLAGTTLEDLMSS